MDRLIRPLLRVRSQRRSEGFTLIEVVVAMGILATGLLAVSAAQLYAMRGGRSGRHTTDAAEIAQSQVEVFQRMDFADPGLAATGGWSPAGGTQVDRSVQTPGVPVVEQSYSLQWRIVNGPLVSGRVFLKTIDVQVTWDEPNRPGRSYTMSTMRHNDARSAK
jgi:prepilin-type N-terminal cleavage/methylation domain-containing protein